MCDKYYGNYDKIIKSIRGGGVITPNNPPNRINTTDTIKNTLNNKITPTSPLYKSTYYSNKNLTNGYLNDNNYVLKDKSISNYYYQIFTPHTRWKSFNKEPTKPLPSLL